MALLHTLVGILLCATICAGGRVPRNMRPRQDAPTTTTTASAAPPTPTICGDLIDDVNQGYNLFYASDVFDCLVSVPFDAAVALRFLDYYNTTMQFQSTLAYLRAPPAGYQQPAVDFQRQLAAIRANVTAGAYRNQYAFEADVQHLVQSLHDAHVYLVGGALSAFAFGSDYTLMTVSVDGVQAPQVYFQEDVARRGQYDISPIVEINGQDAVEYLTQFAAVNAFGSLEPHGDWNQLMYSPIQDVLEYYDTFSGDATFYWGDGLNFTLANGTLIQDWWTALYINPDFTGPLTTGGDFYNYFVLGLLPASYDDVPLPCVWNENITCPAYSNATADGNTTSPSNITSWFNATNGAFPADPAVAQHDLAYGTGGGIVTGYVLDDMSVGVLSIPSFDELGWTVGNFSEAVDKFINISQTQNIAKIVIDLQGNSGGAVGLAFVTFGQFFPQLFPFAGSRRRSHALADVLGTTTTDYWNAISLSGDPDDKYDGEASEWVITDRINALTGRNFTSWAEYYGPVAENGDTFSLVEQYDLGNEEFDWAAFDEWAPVNYVNGVNTSAVPPWNAEDVIILTDGVCSSTCALFLEMMTTQAGVRTVVVGGRPEPGPMQAAGGSRGALAYSGAQLDLDIQQALDDGPTPAAAALLPPLDNTTGLRDSGMYLLTAALNLRDQVRSANYTSTSADGGGVLPLQFAYEAADCRLYWTLDNALNMTRLWADAASAMWPGLPGGPAASCVPGSTGYAAHTTAAPPNAPPDSAATSVAPLPAVEWDYDASPSDAWHDGLEDEGGPTRVAGLTLKHLTECNRADEGKRCPRSQTTCRFVQTTCNNGQPAPGSKSYCVPTCRTSAGCGLASLFCDTSGGTFLDSNSYVKLSRAPGGSTAGSKRLSNGYCVPKPSADANKQFGCPA